MRPGEAARLPEVLPRPLEIRPPRVVEIKVLQGIWGHYDELVRSGQYEPSTLTRAFLSFARQLFPASEPTTRITFDDGTVLILLGGGPDSGALAGQAAFLLGAQGAVASSASLRQAVMALFGHLGREAAESVADEVIQQTTGLPVGPSGLRPRKRKARAPVASSPEAGTALRSKLRALQQAQRNAVRTQTLPDGRIRYYDAERPASTAGTTRGSAYVTEWDPGTGRVRSWVESYDRSGKVIRVHPKMIDGQQSDAPHYPPTGEELDQ
jgi:hypothetical protein